MKKYIFIFMITSSLISMEEKYDEERAVGEEGSLLQEFPPPVNPQDIKVRSTSFGVKSHSKCGRLWTNLYRGSCLVGFSILGYLVVQNTRNLNKTGKDIVDRLDTTDQLIREGIDEEQLFRISVDHATSEMAATRHEMLIMESLMRNLTDAVLTTAKEGCGVCAEAVQEVWRNAEKLLSKK